MPNAAKIEDPELELAMLEKSKELYALAQEQIPTDTGHMSVSLWSDHISVTITSWDKEVQRADILAHFWADPRQEEMEVQHGG